jgi:hypothetical protein
MGWYEAIKDAISVARKADNIDVVQSLIDAQQQIVDMQKEMEVQREEVKRLKDNSDLAKKIERYNNTYVTFSDDDKKIKYCSSCWDKEEKVVQISFSLTNSLYNCPNIDCGNKDIFVEETKEFIAANSPMGQLISALSESLVPYIEALSHKNNAKRKCCT